MTEITTNASPPSLSAAHTGRNRFVKVKRKLNERPLPILVLEEGAQTCLYLLSSTSEKDANVVARQTVAIDTFLSELKNDEFASAKRPRVEAIPVRLNMQAAFTKGFSDEEAEDSAYDYYVQRDPAHLRQVMIDDYSKIGIITSFQEVEFASDEELDLEICDDEDSNAEDYYKNDYPDEGGYYESEDYENGMYSTEAEGLGHYDEFDDDYSHLIWRESFPHIRHRENTSDSDCWLYKPIIHPSDEEIKDTEGPLQ